MGKLAEEDINDALAVEKEVEEQMPDVRWIRAHYSAEEGKVYCEYEAPSMEEVYEFNRRAGMPADHATVVQNLEPSMFR